ncbi:MAG: hypothetical protein G01um101466_746 [Parcubacteria group bacterium Gr01-1014_66]|nr:MAG: hypothetical protein G01um101466_746 [Parcubacteria group bacterium Gr01-1014_66]
MEERNVFPSCIAYREDGSMCRHPATILDTRRGGMVCAAHTPDHNEEHAALQHGKEQPSCP